MSSLRQARQRGPKCPDWQRRERVELGALAVLLRDDDASNRES
jgi:hypothetical protein